jgi:outer membrane protein TolC
MRATGWHCKHLLGSLVALTMTGGAAIHAQSATTLTIQAAVETARQEAPGAVEAAARAGVSTAEVDEARAAYLPRVDGLWQINRASRNNVFGLLLPQNIIPSISGPVLGTDSFESAWGSAAGLLFSFEAFDFGRRAASLRAARSQAEASAAVTEAARLEAGGAAADAFLSALGADQSVIAARANVERLEVLLRTITSQVQAGLKPGADQSRLEAELASARNQQIGAEQSRALARLRLAAAIGRPGEPIALDPGRLVDQLPGSEGRPEANTGEHPLVRAAGAAATATDARVDSIVRQYRPRIFFNAAMAVRASGANVDGTIDGSHGLLPNVPNWAAGLTVSFPFLDQPVNSARARAAAALGAADQARLAAATQHATEASLQAAILADAARKMAANIPIQLRAAQEADVQARARYEAGLTGITEVAEAQRLLARAETEAALASLAIWRARLAAAVAAGDLGPFLLDAAQPAGPRTKP